MTLHQYDYLLAVGTIFAFLDAWNIGANDVANSWASSVSSRSVTYVQAMIGASLMEFSGALGVGGRVADTIRTKVVDVNAFNQQPALLMLGMVCAVIASSCYLTFATRFGMPVSTTHSILGGVLGMGIGALGNSGITWVGYNKDGSVDLKNGVIQVFLAWVIAPILSGLFGAGIFLITKYGVLLRANPTMKGLILVPIYFWLTASLIVMLLIWKGGDYEVKLTEAQIPGVIVAAGAAWGLLVSVFLVPWLYRVVIKEDWQLKAWHIFQGPFLLRRGEVPPPPENFTGVVRNFYEGHLTREELDSRRARANIHTTEDIEGQHEKTASSSGASAQDDLEPSTSTHKSIVGPKPDAAWYSSAGLWWWFKWVLLRGIDQDVVSSQSKKSVIAGDVEEIHARARHYDNKAEFLYTFLQVMTAAAASFTHGANDVANAVGPYATIYQIWNSGAIPKKAQVDTWILAFGGAGIVIGLWTYGYHIMRNLGNRVTLMSPSRGFSMELGSVITVIMATRLKLPVSTTQCITGAIVGVGLCNGDWRAINWRMVAWIYLGWIITVPATGLISGILMGFITFSPHWTISLGKYGSFPSNLLIERPFHLTYEVQEKRDGESFSRLRVVPGTELNAEILAEKNVNEESATDGEAAIVAGEGEELALVDETGKVVARSNREIIDDSARQTLTSEEIEELKKKGTSAGKDLIAKLMLSHTAIDQKTAYSLAKYRLLKERKFLRRFTVLPLDVVLLGQWLLQDRDAGKVLELRAEMMGLLGCWADVHFGGAPAEVNTVSEPQGGRWLVVDDTGGLLVAAMADRMGILHQENQGEDDDEEENEKGDHINGEGHVEDKQTPVVNGIAQQEEQQQQPSSPKTTRHYKKRPRRDDLDEHYAPINTITLIHANSQPNLSILRYFDYDATDPNPTYPYHPLFTNLLPISWLQLVSPQDDVVYSEQPPDVAPEELATWKANRRGNYHRKRRRWARSREIVDSTRLGGFSGLAVASTMDPVSILRHTLPLLAGGSPIAIYSPTIEPLSQLADCFSIGRRAAWVSSPPTEVEGKTQAELDRWGGSEEFPINPSLVLGAAVQSSRARRWQVLPGRTHPFMTGRGGADGFLFTGWRAIPAEGRISARGKFQKKVK
ncbi:Na+/Pi symporter [Conoideocrella luteorostrata]|uniref:Na+/Pi symporter n=1 Tax=Conoideocrella luteorostrata TaxID=1105319 RepID=A0AAJ0FX85_9HYPO|nr:Na+/Pi symporter [Conoideocrella luteorostrata]